MGGSLGTPPADLHLSDAYHAPNRVIGEGFVVGLTCREWSGDEFDTGRAVWQELILRSGADPLFMSWDWQHLWWLHFGSQAAARLRLIAVYAGSRLVGLAPFYERKVTHRGGLRARRWEVIGLCWRSDAGGYSERLDVIADLTQADAVVEAVSDYLRDTPSWDDLVVPFTRPGSIAQMLATRLAGPSAYLRRPDVASSRFVRIAGSSFPEYLSSLSGSTRRRLYNQRAPELRVRMAMEDERAPWIHWLAEHSAQRWQDRYCGAVGFDLDVGEALARAGSLQLTGLFYEGRLISVYLGARLGGREYYLRSAFADPAPCRGSPGFLHFGFTLEHAFEDRLDSFDFLAGQGKHRDYKADLATDAMDLSCLQVVRDRPLRLLYQSYDGTRRLLRPHGLPGVVR